MFAVETDMFVGKTPCLFVKKTSTLLVKLFLPGSAGYDLQKNTWKELLVRFHHVCWLVKLHLS